MWISNRRSEGEKGGGTVTVSIRTVAEVHSMKSRAFSDSTGLCHALSKDK